MLQLIHEGLLRFLEVESSKLGKQEDPRAEAKNHTVQWRVSVSVVQLVCNYFIGNSGKQKNKQTL